MGRRPGVRVSSFLLAAVTLSAGLPGMVAPAAAESVAVAPGVVEWVPRGAPVNPTPVDLAQPDGATFTAHPFGDGRLNGYETPEGYTVVQAEGGEWRYAQPPAGGRGELRASSRRPDRGGPPAGTPKGLRPPDSAGDAPSSGPSSAPASEPAPAPGADGSPSAGPVNPHVGTEASLVLLAEFTGVDDGGTTVGEMRGTTDAASWHDKYFGPTNSVAHFYTQASGGDFTFTPAAETSGTANDGVVGWLPLDMAHPDSAGSFVPGGGEQQVTAAAIAAADPFVNFASYDADSDGYVEPHELHVTVITAGYETSYGDSQCGASMWGHRWQVPWELTTPHDGKWVGLYGYTMFGERHCYLPFPEGGTGHQATIGIMVHEMGHDIDLPDLYDTDGTSEGVGEWSVMGGGSWNYTGFSGPAGNSPSLLDPFSRSYLGWTVPTEATTGSNHSLAAASVDGEVVQVEANPNGVDWTFNGSSGTGEYFLVENRTLTGYDAGLPGCGVLIWHINEAATGSNGANATDTARLVDVEEADGLFHLDSRTNRGDGGDPWPGTAAKTVFDGASVPDSNFIAGTPSGTSVEVTSASCADTANVTASPEASMPTGPANDDFVDAASLVDTATGSNVGATAEVDEPDMFGQLSESVWWSWTAPSSDEVSINTFGSDFDTVLAVYIQGGGGTGVGALAEAASNDDAGTGSPQSEVVFIPSAETTYYIQVDGSGTATGSISLSVGAPGSPPGVVEGSIAEFDGAPAEWAYVEFAQLDPSNVPTGFSTFAYADANGDYSQSLDLGTNYDAIAHSSEGEVPSTSETERVVRESFSTAAEPSPQLANAGGPDKSSGSDPASAPDAGGAASVAVRIEVDASGVVTPTNPNDFDLQTPQLYGKVLIGDGPEVLSDAWVDLYADDGFGGFTYVHYSEVTSLGSYGFNGIPNGEYMLQVSPYDTTYGVPPMVPVTISGGVPTPANPLDLSVGGNAVTGTVLDPDSLPVAYAYVDAYNDQAGQPGSWWGWAQTDASGGYALNLPPGSYHLQATGPGGTILQKSVYVPVTVADPPAGQEVNLTLRAPIIHGTVFEPDTTTVVPYASVEVYDDMGNYVTESNSTETGEYGVLVDDGVYTVRATPNSPGALAPSDELTVTVTAGGTSVVPANPNHLYMNTPTFTGTVMLPDGTTPASGASVLAQPIGTGDPVSASTDSTGEFGMVLQPSTTYALRASYGGHRDSESLEVVVDAAGVATPASGTLVLRAAQPGAVITNGTVTLGVSPEGHLNTNDGSTASAQGTLATGLRFNATNNEFIAPGCLCEGWGVADAAGPVSGYASVDNGGISPNLESLSFTADADSATSVVTIGDTFQVTHDYQPSTASPLLYETAVTIQNISGAAVDDVRYRRAMDWDMEPTAFSEYVTIETGNASNLLYSSDDGFANVNPLAGPSSLAFAGEAVDSGPSDHGALFDFGFGALPIGESVTFTILYGAAGTETAALDALTTASAEVYSLGQPDTGMTSGEPNTAIFGFTGVGGDPAPTCQDDAMENNDTPATATLIENADPINGIACDGDDDYFKIQAEAGETVVATLTWDDQGGTVPMTIQLLDADGVTVLDEAVESTTGDESVQVPRAVSSITSIKVTGHSGASQYAVSAQTVVVARFEESVEGLEFSSGWSVVASGGRSEGQARRASEPGSTMQVSFRGPVVRWISTVAPVYGTAEVTIDGVSHGSVDLYHPYWRYQREVFSAAGLGDGLHVLTITVAEVGNPSSGGTFVEVDALEAEDVVVPRRFEESVEGLEFSSGWSVVASGGRSEGQARRASEPGSTMQVSFRGPVVRWISTVAPVYGTAEVTIDGVSHGSVDLYHPYWRYQREVFSAAGLGDGLHVLTITVAEVGNPSSGGTFVEVDALEAEDVVVPRRFEESVEGLEFSSGWSVVASGGRSEGQARRASEPGSTMQVSFRGPVVRWISTVAPVYGTAEVTIDGVSHGSVDLYHPYWRYQREVFSAAGLGDGLHVLTITVAEVGNPSSGGTFVEVDALEAEDVVVPRRFEESVEGLEFSSGWSVVASGGRSEGQARRASEPGSTMQVSFRGPVVRWISTVAPVYGTAEVTIDGVSHGSVDLYHPYWRYQREVFSAAGLGDGLHVLTITVAEVGNPSSGGTFVEVDALEAEDV